MGIYENRKSCMNGCKPTVQVKEEEEELTPKNSCPTSKVTSISVDKGKVHILYDDCTFHTSDVSVLSESIKAFLTQANDDTQEKVKELLERVTALEGKEDKDTIFDPSKLETKISEIENTLNLINVEDSNGNVMFKAIKAGV